MSEARRISVALVERSDHPDAIETFERIEAKSGVGNIHRTLANSPTLFKAFIGLSYALRYATEIDPLERELAICCVLERHQGDYELAPHRRLAGILGATEDQISHVSDPGRTDVYSDRQRAILRFAARIAADPRERASLPDDEIEAFLDNRQRIELGVTLGIYMGLAHFTALFDVPPEDFSARDAPLMEQAAKG